MIPKFEKRMRMNHNLTNSKSNLPFPCSSCGLCCRHITFVEELKPYDRGDGICQYFDEHSCLCQIYENRPLVCRVEESYDKIYQNYFKDKLAFYEVNAKVCNDLQEKYGIDKNLRVII